MVMRFLVEKFGFLPTKPKETPSAQPTENRRFKPTLTTSPRDTQLETPKIEPNLTSDSVKTSPGLFHQEQEEVVINIRDWGENELVQHLEDLKDPNKTDGFLATEQMWHISYEFWEGVKLALQKTKPELASILIPEVDNLIAFLQDYSHQDTAKQDAMHRVRDIFNSVFETQRRVEQATDLPPL